MNTVATTETPAEMPDLEAALAAISDARRSAPARRAVLTALTGIDGCGKGFVAARIVAALRAEGIHAEAINIDGWLNLPDRRFDPANSVGHFYEHAIRFDELFSRLVLPLRDGRAVRLVADHAAETASEYTRRLYNLDDVDVVVLEGIYLLKRRFQPLFDVSVWIDCTFETALDRAVARAQEGLPPEETIGVYRTIYFPAQELHFRQDDPRGAATVIVRNDPRLESAAAAGESSRGPGGA